MFKDLLYHRKHGIPVYILGSEYIILWSKEVDLELFLEEITIKDDSTQSPQLTRDFVGSLLKNMDSAWDRKIFKVALGATHTRQQLTDIGISSRTENYTQLALQAIEERNGMESEARCLVTKNLSRRAESMSERMNKLNFKLNQKIRKWNDTQINEVKGQIQDLMMQQENLKNILDN